MEEDLAGILVLCLLVGSFLVLAGRENSTLQNVVPLQIRMNLSTQGAGSSPYLQRNGTDLTLNGGLFRCAGAADSELLWEFLHTDLGLPANEYQSFAMKNLNDAGNNSIPFLRVAASPYWPISYYQWIHNTTAYWRIFDQMVSNATARGIKLILEIVHNQFAFSDVVKEPLSQLFNASSRTYAQLTNYTSQLVTRYRNSTTVLAWELMNELNLFADLDFANYPSIAIAPSLGTPANRTSKDNFSTDMMITFTQRFTTFIKQMDPNHLVTTGFSIPRQNAQNLRMKPEWSPGGPDHAPDTFSQFQQYLKDTNPDPVDFVSIHFYNSAVDGSQRFGIQGQYTADLLEYVKNATAYLGKPLWIGEFGDTNPTISVNPYANFTQNVLTKSLTLSIPASAIWVWEFYQGSPPASDSYSLEPGKTDFIIKRIAETNQILGCPLLPLFGFRLSLNTNPPSGRITINGTPYGSGYWYRFALGKAIARANPPAGYHFTSWSTTGGVTVSNPTNIQTTVTIAGQGILTANSTNSPTTPITTITILLAAMTTSILLRRKRER